MSSKNIFESLKARRSVFPNQFSDAPISKDELLKLLETTNWAPTHRRTEPWRFKVIYSEQSKAKFSSFAELKTKETNLEVKDFKLRKTKEKIESSAAILLICMQRDQQKSVPEWEEIAATAMAVQNLWLAAAELNIGGYWSSPSWIKFMHEFVELNQGERCLGMFYLGKIQTPSPTKDFSDFNEKLQWL